MDDLAQGRQRRALTQLAGRSLQILADQVLDSLDVVAGDGLELAQALDVLGAEIAGERAQVVALRVRQRRAPGRTELSSRKISHSISTCTRARFRPASDR